MFCAADAQSSISANGPAPGSRPSPLSRALTSLDLRPRTHSYCAEHRPLDDQRANITACYSRNHTA
jgi:hypothetical protein